MKVTIKDCEKLFFEAKFQEAREIAAELLFQNQNCDNSLLLLFHSSLTIGDDGIALVALNQLKEAGFKGSVDLEERLKYFVTSRQEVKKWYELKKYEKCLESVNIALEVFSGSFDLQILKAKCFIRLNFPILAKGIIEKLIAEDSDNETLVFLQGVVKFYLGQLEEGLKYVKRAIDIDPEEKKYWEMKEKIKKFLEPVQKAKKLGASRQYEAAVAIFTNQIESDVHYAWCFELLIMRAQTYKAFLQFDQAIADISRAFTLPDVYNINEQHQHLELRAECFYAKGDYNNCIIDCQRALRTSDAYTLKLLLKKANERKKLEEILKKIENGKLKEAYEMSYQNFETTRNGEFFIFAIQCARVLKDKNTVAKLLESIKENEELLDIVKISMGQHEEETMTTPDEFAQALACYNDGNFGKCIEILENAKKEDVQMEKFPHLTYQKAQKILKHILDAAKLQKEKNFVYAVKNINEAMAIEPFNDKIKEKLLYCRGTLHVDSKNYQKALSDFQEISPTSNLQKKIEEIRKTCIKEISVHEQKLSQFYQKARRSNLAKNKCQPMEH